MSSEAHGDRAVAPSPVAPTELLERAARPNRPNPSPSGGGVGRGRRHTDRRWRPFARRARITAATKNLPIVFLTARTAPADFIAGIQAGAKHYITKPFAIADLLAKVGKILGE